MTIKAKQLEDFRSTFKPIVGNPKGYEGSTMLYVPYEEVIHYLQHSMSTVEQNAYTHILHELQAIKEELGLYQEDSSALDEAIAVASESLNESLT